MKYIRLKDKIYTDNNLYTITKVHEDSRFKVGDKALSTDKIFEKVEDKDIADTIEELCDVFIVIDEDKKRNIYLKEDGWTFDMIQDLGMWSDRTCYGAIWTDKGLIYVAKMNEDGELCLI